ncbi:MULTISPECIES: formyltetrahydrofolate deformylase [unclassified Oleiphilus]|jgi:formyltetrahydrofolate deformylase|uniref:formyltetrahydrofolate deformylase n=2 Tax=Oleiphilus TaxID=141450 RepID=UPI0007C347CF|nr:MULTISPECIES: formyltetrahydrofolate deformylase [unclassified Oleiphilus]KZY77261.1 formyltetrahydrofolate deformylase [Oleiphilus sp. HI0068]KZY77326.1 formyltetrahydrofolate deformylase [Oleiphilus sp. HI0069]KZY88042.1 formyltetrahydrofolate deformylase [Oleiphilus sp. HI0072]KZZ07944.1 formyltetrahydrofolate deformylase [Oleiphilus sp. HI0078]KZZ21942.1 formyltetrahydrofolate deformylase [Oleiphilus sp. HI0081]KZZ47703.1 formyltetrahydrofolate deformylase [Oleiphilus sp. HI0085]
MEQTYRLVVSCPDRTGIVAKVSNFLATYNGWITEASYHADQKNGWFFMRNEIKASSIPFDLENFKTVFEPIAKEFSMSWSISDSNTKKRVVLMASKESHCLADLLHRWHSNELDAEIVAVISNHDDLRRMVEWHDIPYHHVPVDPQNKQAAFDQVSSLVDEYQTDLVVLARYMQILPADLCETYAGRVINIHHSFLPSFAGAKPYHQAYDRGVKLIGATCHYVTQDLDEGPIIDQDVIRISHSNTIEDMVRLGKDAEKNVLARGLRLHLEERVIIHENKTVVFG